MGMRFRKSFGIKGARVNLSKSGIGCSVGTKGARYTKLANGRTKTTLSVPGTGLSYVSESGNGSKGNSTGSVAAQTSLKEQSAGMLKSARASALFIGVLTLLLSITCFTTIILIPLGVILGAVAIGSFLTAKSYKKELKERRKNSV